MVKGYKDAFDTLFQEFYTDLCRFAYTYVKNEGHSEEIVQDLFIYIWEQHSSLEIKTSLRAYLYTSVKNRSLNYLRNQKTRKYHEDSYAQELPQQMCQIINFCEKEELQNLITDSLNELPEQCRLIFELSRNENLTYNEIAQKLSLSPKTVENQIGIALKKLRSKLAPYLSCVLAIL